MSRFTTALVQLAVTASKTDNLRHAADMVRQAAEHGAKLIALPECFNSPYGVRYFREYAEKIPSGPTHDALRDMARENGVYLVGGSIPESNGEKLYNTSMVFDPSGSMLAKHRKVHLFDIDIPGKITFRESEILSAGDQLTTFKTEWCRVGLGICYDIRFPLMAKLYADEGCKLLIYPGAFNMTTGPVHWELLTRSTALNHQVYTAMISPARDETAKYVAWGHSCMANPWGELVASTAHEETIIYADVDLSYVEEVRGQIPVTVQARHDLYTAPKRV